MCLNMVSCHGRVRLWTPKTKMVYNAPDYKKNEIFKGNENIIHYKSFQFEKLTYICRKIPITANYLKFIYVINKIFLIFLGELMSTRNSF